MSDLISREETLIRIRECYPSPPIFEKNRKAWLKNYEGFIRAYEIIKAVPTAVPKVGKWEENEHGLKCCSVCGKRPLQICYYDINYDGYTGKDILSKYCPHCGAKMERSE